MIVGRCVDGHGGQACNAVAGAKEFVSLAPYLLRYGNEPGHSSAGRTSPCEGCLGRRLAPAARRTGWLIMQGMNQIYIATVDGKNAAGMCRFSRHTLNSVIGHDMLGLLRSIFSHWKGP
jgi:hypothetical protein